MSNAKATPAERCVDFSAPVRPAPRRYLRITSNDQRFGFIRELLPSPIEFYPSQGITLSRTGTWRDALCPFHNDTRPSLRVSSATGAFRCMACGAKGGDVLAFYMLQHGLRFVDAAKELGAWSVLR